MEQEIKGKKSDSEKKYKSHLAFAGLNLILPGFGLYYMSKKSIYWDQNPGIIISSIMFTIADIVGIYNFIKGPEFHSLQVISIVLRIEFGIFGHYFINYDNKLIKAGYHIQY